MHELDTIGRVLSYIRGGNCRITIQNEKTQTHLTYKFKQSKRNPSVYWVSVLSRFDYESEDSYKFLGGYSDELSYRYSEKSQIKATSKSASAIQWFFDKFLKPNAFKAKYPTVKVFYQGTCGRCGKLLTHPESLKVGFGRECLGWAIKNGLVQLPAEPNKIDWHHHKHDKPIGELISVEEKDGILEVKWKQLSLFD